jgi:hypothetical protein
MPLAAPVRHQQADIIAGMGHIKIDDRSLVNGLRHVAADRLQHAQRWPGMAPNTAHIRFDRTQRKLHRVNLLVYPIIDL